MMRSCALACLLIAAAPSMADSVRTHLRDEGEVIPVNARVETHGVVAVTGTWRKSPNDRQAFVTRLDAAGHVSSDTLVKIGPETTGWISVPGRNGASFVAGLTSEFTVASTDLWVAGLDERQEVRWTLRIGKDNQLRESGPQAAYVDAAGNLYLVSRRPQSTSASATQATLLVKVSQDGRLLWEKEVPPTTPTTAPRALLADKQGNLVLVMGLRYPSPACMVLTLSGADGRELWREEVIEEGLRPTCLVADTLADGTARLILDYERQGARSVRLADVDESGRRLIKHDLAELAFRRNSLVLTGTMRPNGNALLLIQGDLYAGDDSWTRIVEVGPGGLAGPYIPHLPPDSSGSDFIDAGYLIAGDNWIAAHTFWTDYTEPESYDDLAIFDSNGARTRIAALNPEGALALLAKGQIVRTDAGPTAVLDHQEGSRSGFRVVDVSLTDSGPYRIDEKAAGAFFDAANPGQGWFIEPVVVNFRRRLLAAWYTFLDGEPKWLIGLGEVDGNVAVVPLDIATGGDFPPRFRSASVERQAWGEATITFDSADSARVAWTTDIAGYGSGNLSLQRLTQPAPETLVQAPTTVSSLRPCHSGSWFDPAQDGHGLMFQILTGPNGPQLAAIWYAFINGKQTWLLGSGPILGDSAQVTMQLASGGQFPGRGNAPVQLRDWGVLSVKAVDREQLHATWSSPLQGFGSGTLNLTSITRHELKYCD
jgi:hypothetical protein